MSSFREWAFSSTYIKSEKWKLLRASRPRRWERRILWEENTVEYCRCIMRQTNNWRPTRGSQKELIIYYRPQAKIVIVASTVWAWVLESHHTTAWYTLFMVLSFHHHLFMPLATHIRALLFPCHSIAPLFLCLFSLKGAPSLAVISLIAYCRVFPFIYEAGATVSHILIVSFF